MKSKQIVQLPAITALLKMLGEKIRSARKRRMWTLEELANMADIARSTLCLIEKGSPGVSIGAYIQVLYFLGFERELKEMITK